MIQNKVDSALLLKKQKQEVIDLTTRVEYDAKLALGELKKK